jgi:hypothetical protein
MFLEESWWSESCEANIHRVIRNTVTGSGSSSESRAGVSIDMSDGSSVLIAVLPATPDGAHPTFPVTYNNYERVEWPAICGGTREETSSGTDEREMLSYFEVQTTLDPRNPNVLAGTSERRSGELVETITWNLRRVP